MTDASDAVDIAAGASVGVTDAIVHDVGAAHGTAILVVAIFPVVPCVAY